MNKLNNRDTYDIKDDDLEKIFREQLDRYEPEFGITSVVTPWKKYMLFILWGIMLSSYGDFYGVISIIGYFMQLLGFRILRKENRYFAIGYICSWIGLLLKGYESLKKASIWSEIIISNTMSNIMLGFGILVGLLHYVCLWLGLWKVEEKAGKQGHSKSPLVLVVWDVIVVAFVLCGYSEGMVAWIAIISYIVIFICLIKVYQSLVRVGYAMRPALIKVPGWCIVVSVIVVYMVMHLFVISKNIYPMEWEKCEKDRIETNSQNAEVMYVKADLVAMGAPEFVLNDMTDEEILACAGAVEVVVEEEDYPFNNGREVTTFENSTTDGDTTSISSYTETVYDVKELHITSVAIQIEEEQYRWKVIHHFAWNVKPEYCGTDAITVSDEDVDGEAEITGRLLCEKNGETYIADYYNTGNENNYQSFFGTEIYYFVMSGISFDKDASKCRGYICYEAVDMNEVYRITSHFSYYHSNKWYMYPAQSALEYAQEHGIFSMNENYRKANHFFRVDEEEL